LRTGYKHIDKDIFDDKKFLIVCKNIMYKYSFGLRIIYKYTLQGGPKTGPFFKVHNSCTWWRHRKAFKMLMSVSYTLLNNKFSEEVVQLLIGTYWMSPYLNILCISLEKR